MIVLISRTRRVFAYAMMRSHFPDTLPINISPERINRDGTICPVHHCSTLFAAHACAISHSHLPVRLRRGQLAAVPGAGGDGTFGRARPAAQLERDEQRRLEDADPRPRLVVSGHLRRSDMADYRRSGRAKTLRDLR